MSWQDYITNIMGPDMRDAVICGYKPFSVWAAECGGELCKITAAEVQALVSEDHSSFFTNGLTIAGMKCSLLRDNFTDSFTLDVRTKATEGPTYNIAVAKSCTALILLMGKEGTHGGVLNAKVHAVAKYLQDRNM
ncbi:profilin-1 [Phyllobates terribilis]|uniref:profilin-1 n=1 Tax=Phyllobates terribilis TaxID=111132 RepID=UPI003CCAB2AF